MNCFEMNGLFSPLPDRPVKCYIGKDKGEIIIVAVPELGVSLAIDPEAQHESFRKGIKVFEGPLFPAGALHAMELLYNAFGFKIPDYI